MRLRRENSRLKKRIQQLNSAIHSMGTMPEEEEEEVPVEKKHYPKGDDCPSCGKSSVHEMDLGVFLYDWCHECKWRRRKV